MAKKINIFKTVIRLYDIKKYILMTSAINNYYKGKDFFFIDLLDWLDGRFTYNDKCDIYTKISVKYHEVTIINGMKG